MYQVVAPLVVAVGPDGKTNHRYTGELVEFADPATAAYLVAQGMVAEIDIAAPASDAPAFVAPKAQWVAYAVGKGFDKHEAESMTKAQLIEALK